MAGHMKWIGLVLVVASVCMAESGGYSPQPYSPVKNSRAQRMKKQVALDALRERWTGDDFSAPVILKMLSKHGTKDPGAVVGHFHADGSWNHPLPVGDDFSDADYELNQRYFYDLLALAYLDRFEGKEQRRTLYQSLAWYFANGHAAPPEYHKTFSYHEPETVTAGLLTMIGLVLFDEIHADRLTDPSVEAVFQQMRAYGRQFIDAAPQIRGPNWSFRLDNCLRYVLFTDNPDDMDEYAYHWNKALSFNRWEAETDGVHPDWSMMHHGDMNYWGMYGIAWTSRVIEYGELLAGSPWEYKSKQLDFIANCMTEGVRWSLYRGNCEYSSAPKRGSFLLARTDSVAASFKELILQLLALGGDQLSNRAGLNELAEELILPPWSADGPVDLRPEFSGHRYFWTTEYQVHRRPGFAIYTRRCSQRTRPPEDSSQKQGTLHLNYGTGYTPIMQSGDELRLSRLAWDFEKVPGTTVEQGCTVSSGKAAGTKRGLNLFSGGVDDGVAGCGAFDMQMVEFDREESGSHEFINGAGALKGTFFFDDGMLALGQNIRRIAQGTGNILTTINNVMRRGPVIYSVDGEMPKTIAEEAAIEQQIEVRDVAWVWHDGIGYVVSGPAQLSLSCGDQPFHERLSKDKDFKKVIQSELGNDAWKKQSFNMFRLWTDHGADPSMQTYSYAVLPGCSVKNLKKKAARVPQAVRQNDAGIQAVEKDGIRYAVFLNPGTARFADGVTIASDIPLMVMARKVAAGRFEFYASNPVHRGLRRPFVPGSGKTVGTLYEEPIVIRTAGFGDAASVSFALPCERGMEGASVQGTQIP